MNTSSKVMEPHDACRTILFSALGIFSAVAVSCHLYQRKRNNLKRDGALSIRSDSIASRQLYFKSLTGLEDPDRAMEVMDASIIPIFQGDHGLVLSEKPLSQTPGGATGWKARLDKLLMLCTQHEKLEIDQHFSTPDVLISFTSHIPITRDSFDATASILLGPTYPSETHFNDISTLFTNARSIPSLSGWMPSSQRTALTGPRDRVMKSLVRFLEDWWYLDGLGEIGGLSKEVEQLLKVAKEEELGVEETAGIILYILECVFNGFD